MIELAVNLDAIYTECDDQSSWYYMRNLLYIALELGEKDILSKEEVSSLISQRLKEIQELLEEEPNCIYGPKFVEELRELETEAKLFVCLLATEGTLLDRE